VKVNITNPIPPNTGSLVFSEGIVGPAPFDTALESGATAGLMGWQTKWLLPLP
jgi:hypothetical protein